LLYLSVWLRCSTDLPVCWFHFSEKGNQQLCQRLHLAAYSLLFLKIFSFGHNFAAEISNNCGLNRTVQKKKSAIPG